MSKPRVLVLADLPGWAWEHKAKQLQRNLRHTYDIDIACLYEPGYKAPTKYDLYHTFEVLQATRLPASYPFVTGITAHVMQTWETRHGAGTVAKWAAPALALHANSRLLQRELSALVGRPVEYTPNGVDEKLFRRTRPHLTDRLRVGFVGKRDHPRKGFEIVKDACAAVGASLAEVQHRVQDAKPLEDMVDFYQDIHVLAVASDFDGTPNPALEAAACGSAVVGNRIGNLPEFIFHGVNGLLVERSVESLADGLSSLTVERACNMGLCARREIEARWTWRHMARNYDRLWSMALGNS